MSVRHGAVKQILRAFALIGLSVLAGGCARTPSPRRGVVAAPNAPGGRPRPAARRSQADPLSALVERLRESDPVPGFFADLDEKFLTVLSRQSKKTFPPMATLSALLVKSEDELVGAFLAVLPAKHKRCSDQPAERPILFWLSVPKEREGEHGTARLSGVATRLFDGEKASVEMPTTFPQVPFFEVDYDLKCESTVPGGGSEYSDQSNMEVFSITPQGLRLVKRFESYTHNPAGTTLEVKVKLRWIRGRNRKFYLAATDYSVSRTPLTSAPTGGPDDSEDIHFSCLRATTVYELTPAGKWSVIPAAALTRLKAKQPELGKLPKDAKADGNTAQASLPACDALAP